MIRARLFARLLEPAAREGLAPDFEPSEVRGILDEAIMDYEARRPQLPREKSRGGRLMVHLASQTEALYRALLGRGLTIETSRALTARTTWQAYERMAAVPTWLSRLGHPSPRERLKRATGLFRRFPFNAPAYEMIDVDVGDDVVAFDVKRCPVAEYFVAQGLEELCVDAFCNLDFPLAEKWGARLERSTTLAGGGRRCDFRWHAPADRDGGSQ